MAPKAITVALSAAITASPLMAAQPDGPLDDISPAPVAMPAPPGTPITKYCMRVELTGYIVDPVRCWTRAQWAEQGVDVDREWATEGVRVIDA